MGSVVSIIFSNSVMNLQTGMNSTDIGIVLAYFIVMCCFLIIGIYGFTKFKKAKFNGEKTEITLKNPYRTMFLNYGMILFILFFIGEMVWQMLG